MSKIMIDAKVNSDMGSFIVPHLIDTDELVKFIYDSLNHRQIMNFAFSLIIRASKNRRVIFMERIKEYHEELEKRGNQ